MVHGKTGRDSGLDMNSLLYSSRELCQVQGPREENLAVRRQVAMRLPDLFGVSEPLPPKRKPPKAGV